MSKLREYAKGLVAAAVVVVTAVQAALTDGDISTEEWRSILVTAVGAVLVVLVPNKPETPAE